MSSDIAQKIREVAAVLKDRYTQRNIGGPGRECCTLGAIAEVTGAGTDPDSAWTDDDGRVFPLEYNYPDPKDPVVQAIAKRLTPLDTHKLVSDDASDKEHEVIWCFNDRNDKDFVIRRLKEIAAEEERAA